MPKSSRTLTKGQKVGTWLLCEGDSTAIWVNARLDKLCGADYPADWFSEDVRNCVSAYLSYAWTLKTGPRPDDFAKKCEKIIGNLREVAEILGNANVDERRNFVEIVTALMPDSRWRRPLDPEAQPEIFLSSLVHRLGEGADAVGHYIQTLAPLREQRTDETAVPSDVYQRPFDFFVEKMSAVAERANIPVSASKDRYSPSPFVDLVTAVLAEYREATKSYVESGWEALRRDEYARKKLSDADVEHFIQQEKDGDAFALKLLTKHVESPTAAASAIADALARLRAERSRGK